MSTTKAIIKRRLDKKIRRTNFLLKGLMLLLFIIVAYDSVVHQTPLYYVGFLILGLIVGRIYDYLYSVEHNKTTGQLMLKSNYTTLIITLALVLLRFIVAGEILKSFNVVWINDALYLFFIGVYRSRWKAIEKKIDLKIYQILIRNFKNEKETANSI